MPAQTPASGKRGRPPVKGLAKRRRAQILDAATRIFAARGYRNTDVQVVARAVGVGKGTVYRYFPSKQDLFLAAVDRSMVRLREAIDAAVAGEDDPLRQIERGIHAYLAFFDEHDEMVELFIQERAEFKDRDRPTYFKHRDQNIPKWHDVLRRLIDRGRVRTLDVERVADVVSSLLYGRIFTNYFARQRPSLDVQAHDIVDLVLHGILSDKERSARPAAAGAGVASEQGADPNTVEGGS